MTPRIDVVRRFSGFREPLLTTDLAFGTEILPVSGVDRLRRLLGRLDRHKRLHVHGGTRRACNPDSPPARTQGRPFVADIHELSSPHLLHEVIKGTFKDTWMWWPQVYCLTPGHLAPNAEPGYTASMHFSHCT
ncbi:hypothetical protein B0H13DRAFT_1888723 [Mycena leptocephala]|nr:hypothetical protein B0H13DRAFT_1888723 [Mycena leptocephala]